MIADTNDYQMRGNRVAPLNLIEVKKLAEFYAKILNINKKTPMKLASFLEKLQSDFDGLNIEIVEDDDWLFITEANYDPESKTITLPDSLYNRAISGVPDAVEIVFHELGHYFLGHKAILHHNSEPPKEIEDAEWQADSFSACMMQIMKISTQQQLKLDL